VKRRLLVSALPGETRAAWLRDGRLEDLVVLRDDRPSVTGNLYVGRVTALDKGLDAAFVDIGLQRPGLLPFGECPGGKPHEGGAVIVRALREPAAEKGALLSARITAPPADLETLVKHAKLPTLLLRGGDPFDRLLGGGAAPSEIVVDDLAVYRSVKRRLTAARPELVKRLHHDADPRPLFEREAIEEQIEALLEPRVDLPSGGSLLFEPVRTLTAIDVNSAGRDALTVDLEAVTEIARQLRLRALSGLIVIDFLEMADPGARRRVATALRKAFKNDPEPTRVFPMAPSGLVEMTRRRGRPPLHELLTGPCGIGGGGRVKDAASAGYDALRLARSEAAGNPGRALTVHVAPAVRAALDGPLAEARRAVETLLGRALTLCAEPGWPTDRVEIVLG